MQKFLCLILCIATLCALASCGKNPEHEHEFSMAWSYDETYHWHQATCKHTDMIKGKSKHSYDLNLRCIECGYVTTSSVNFPGNIEDVLNFNDNFSINVINQSNIYSMSVKDNILVYQKPGADFQLNFFEGGYDIYTPKNDEWEKSTVLDDTMTMNMYLNRQFPAIMELEETCLSVMNHFRYDDKTNCLIFSQVGELHESRYTDLQVLIYLNKSYEISYIEFNFYYGNPKQENYYEIVMSFGDFVYEQPVIPSVGLATEVNGDGTCTITGLGNCYDENIIIPLDINGMEVTEIGEAAFKNSDITKVVIPGSVQKIGKSAFEGCEYLEDIVIEDGVEEIGERAFAFIYQEGSIEFSDSVTVIGKDAFLTDDICATQGMFSFVGDINAYAQIQFGNEESTPNLNHTMYVNGYVLTEVILDTATKISSYAFARLTTPEYYFIGKQVVSIGENALSGLHMAQVPGTGAYEFLPYDVYYESSLVEFLKIDINSYWASGTGYLLYCEEELIESVTINNMSTIPNGLFANCASLKSIVIGEGVTSIGEMAFYGCPIEHIEIHESCTIFKTDAFSNTSFYTTDKSVFFEENDCVYMSCGDEKYYLLISAADAESINQTCKFVQNNAIQTIE